MCRLCDVTVKCCCCCCRAVGAEPDGEGVRHLLLCRVLLGRPEQIDAGSTQSHPSSGEFDCAVDDLQEPRKYVVWSSNMNSYILPSYIVSFKSPRLRGMKSRFIPSMFDEFVYLSSERLFCMFLSVIGRGGPPPSSPWVSFTAVVSVLSKFLDASRMSLIKKTFDDFRVYVFVNSINARFYYGVH